MCSGSDGRKHTADAHGLQAGRRAAPNGDETKKQDELKKRMDEIDARQAATCKLDLPKTHCFALTAAK